MLINTITLRSKYMSRTTITLPNSLLDELMSEIEAKSKTDAVVKAIKDEIRMKKTEKIKAMAGKMEFTKSADKLRHEDERLR